MNDLLLPIVCEALDKHGLKYRVLECDPELADTAAFCEHYGFTLAQSANTIIVASRKVEPVRYAACVVLGTHKLDVNKAVCRELGIKKASFADGETTTALTGMQIGGVTVFGINNLPILIDSSVMAQPEVVMGGGNRSSKVVLDPQELLKLPGARVVDGLAAPKPPVIL